VETRGLAGELLRERFVPPRDGRVRLTAERGAPSGPAGEDTPALFSDQLAKYFTFSILF
jgi:hypothetical protein